MIKLRDTKKCKQAQAKPNNIICDHLKIATIFILLLLFSRKLNFHFVSDSIGPSQSYLVIKIKKNS
jgi:hypothetical protein